MKIEIVKGVEGPSIYFDGYRMAGPKPWGGGQIIHSFTIKPSEIPPVAKAEASLAAANAEIERLRKWSIALQDLTPGGSEFQTPDACLGYVRDVRARQLETIKRFMRDKKAAEVFVATLTARVEELEAGLRRLIDCGNAAVGADPSDPLADEALDMWGDARLHARALLQPKDAS